jgi:general stress protein 26
MEKQMPSEPQTEGEKRKKLRSILNDARTAFMVTHSTTHGLHGRPMMTSKIEDDIDTIWFPTDRNSGKIRELAADTEVCLGYTNASGSEWASVNGRARMVDDRAKIKELWNPIWKTWFDSPEDPKLVLIAVTPHSAEYWDSGSQILQMIKFAFTAVTGKRTDEGDNQYVNLSEVH